MKKYKEIYEDYRKDMIEDAKIGFGKLSKREVLPFVFWCMEHARGILDEPLDMYELTDLLSKVSGYSFTL